MRYTGNSSDACAPTIASSVCSRMLSGEHQPTGLDIDATKSQPVRQRCHAVNFLNCSKRTFYASAQPVKLRHACMRADLHGACRAAVRLAKRSAAKNGGKISSPRSRRLSDLCSRRVRWAKTLAMLTRQQTQQLQESSQRCGSSQRWHPPDRTGSQPERFLSLVHRLQSAACSGMPCF